MPAGADFWYVRLPDGRILRSRSTEALRQHLKAGRIPWECRVRRSADDPWLPLDRVPEFASVAPEGSWAAEEAKANDAAAGQTKSSAVELRTLGVRGLVEELFNAFDSSLQKAKLTAAAITGLLLGIVMLAGFVVLHELPTPAWPVYLITGGCLLIVFSACTSILTQMTALELSRYRPSRFGEIRAGLIGSILRLTIAFGLIGGFIVGVIVLLRSLPGWLRASGVEVEMLHNAVTGARLLLEVLCWPILGFAMLLLGPILIVEEYSIWQALREWIGMLRQHLGRIYLYQAIAFAFAAVLTLPLLAPVLLAFGNVRTLTLAESVPFFPLVGIALTPSLSYLLVAHVFIYLNLRYEFYSARER